MTKKKAFYALLVFVAFSLVVLTACKPKEEKTSETMPTLAKAPDIQQRLAKYAPTDIVADPKLLSDEDRAVLNKLIEAGRVVDDIFWQQVYPAGPAMRARLEKSTLPEDKDYLRFFDINYGPFDLQDEDKPFLGTDKKLPGAAFYPADLTKQEFEDYAAKNPAEREALESSFTIVKRENGKLVAVPYPAAYKADVEKTAALLREAAALTSNASLKKYLDRRAADLLSNDYYESDCLWIDLKDNLPEIVIGPYEVYEDNLMGLKASYESFVYLNDREEMQKIRGYIAYLDKMQKNLPVAPKYKPDQIRGLSSPLNVVIQVYAGGKPGIQTSAFVLPNDEKVREKKGSKKVFLKNMMEAKFSKSLIPISQRVLEPADARKVSFFAYFTEVILHEISHVLGVNYVTLPDGTKTTVNKTLKDLAAAIEESKADIAGIYSVPLLVREGIIPKDKEDEIYTSYLAGMFRSMRFGATEAHGLGVLIQYNFMREKGAFVFDPAAEKFKLDFAKFKVAIRDLTARLLTIEGDGSYDGAKELVAKYGTMDAITLKIIEKLKDIPVDIAPIFRASY
jgi:hypothetical protein